MKEPNKTWDQKRKRFINRHKSICEYCNIKNKADELACTTLSSLYLHPQLQSRVLEYVRSVAREENENIQVIIVTNSSALIDKATTEELFMLMPSQQLAEGSNQ